VLYGQPVPAKGERVKVSFAPTERLGLLTQPAFLANFADMDLTKPVRRGLFISERLLCREVPPLPIGMVPPLPPATAETRMRDLLAMHATNPSCKGCHQFMDPLGLALELYDQFGRRRTTDVDASGVLTDSGDQDGPFRDGLELVQRLAQSEAVERCFVRHSFSYWTGREATDADACALEQARTAYASSGGDYVALVQALLTSPAFLERAQP
jgi:hypothetical protein